MRQDSTKPYKLYVFHRSYFCGKMLAYLRYKDIPFEAIYKPLSEIGNTLMEQTGLRQLPAIETPDGQWLQDTTPMIEWFEQRNPEAPILPDNEVGKFFARLIEDYADEWLWRPAIYYRWEFPEDRYLYKSLFLNEFVGGFWTLSKPLQWLGGNLIHRHQKDKFLDGDGVTSQNKKYVESIYINTLDRLETLFQKQDYVMGDRPSFADFGFFGSMFWHFGNDPTPNRIMQERAPAVHEWIARMWNARGSNFDDKNFKLDSRGVPLHCDALLKDICENYLPYLAQNAIEFENGASRFDWNIEGFTYPKIHVSPYRVWCRERIQHFYNALSPQSQAIVADTLNQYGGMAPLLEHSHIQSNWDPSQAAPVCTPGKIPIKHKLLARFTGTNHVRSRRLWKTSGHSE